MSMNQTLFDYVYRLSEPSTLLLIIVLLVVAAMSAKAKKSLPPGPTRYPVVGSLPKLKGDEMFYVKLNELRQLHGDVMYLTLGAVKMLIVFGHDKVKRILSDTNDAFKFRPTWLVEIKSLDLTNGIVWSNGLNNEKLRSFALPALHPGVGPLTLEQRVQEEVKMITEEVQSCSGDSAQLKQIIYRGICNINCGIIFGSRFEYTDPEFLELIDLMDQLLQRQGVKNPLNFFPILQKLPMGKKTKETIEILQKVKQFVSKKIKHSEESFENRGIDSLIGLYIEQTRKGADNDGVTEENICHIARDLFVAGSENVSSGIIWMVAYMIRHTDVQEKCRKSILDIIGNTTIVGMDDVPKLPYVEATMNEVLRLANIAPLSVPHATTQEVQLDEYVIPKDTMVLTHLESVHLDSKYWQDPETFNPDRFIGDDGNVAKKEAFYPFSIGTRYCLAERLARMEIFVSVCSLLQQFRFENPADGVGPSLIPTQPGAFVEPEKFKLTCSPI